jgi:hypothetical protein
MSILNIILTCIFIKLHFVIAIKPEIMYPFGPNSNDITLPKIDDASFGPIRLNIKLRYIII